MGRCCALQLEQPVGKVRGGTALCLHLSTHSCTHTQSTVQAQGGSMGGIKHLAPFECLSWKQAKDSTCLQVPDSLLLATVHLGEAFILVGNMYCCFYVSRTRVSLHFSSSDFHAPQKIPPLSCYFPHPLCRQHVPSSEMLSFQREGG